MRIYSSVSRIFFIVMAACLLNSRISFALAQGNSTSHLIETIDRWSVFQIDTLPQFKYNFPDGLSFHRISEDGLYEFRLTCITRSVDEDIPKISIQILAQHTFNKSRGHLIFTTDDDQILVPAISF